MRLRLISCEVFQREVNAALARSLNRVEVEFLPATLHQLSPEALLERLQSAIDHAEQSYYQAVLLASGSCKKGLTGLTARSVPLVLPRAADCISLFLSQAGKACQPRRSGPTRQPARRRPAELARSSPDERELSRKELTYWLAPENDRPQPILNRHRFAFDRQWNWRTSFGQRQHSGKPLARLDWGSRRRGSPRPLSKPSFTKRSARCLKPLLQLLVDGYWSYDDFLVVPPGWQVVAKPEEGILTAEARSI